MEFILTGFVLFTENVAKSKDFYQNILLQEVVLDIGGVNISFKGGLALWDKKYAQNNIFGKLKPESKSDDIEIYLETSDINAAYERIEKFGVKVIHPISVQPWQQKVFRINDPDGFIIEVAEKMDDVIKRLKSEGLSEKEISAKTFMPEEYVNSVINK